MNELLKKQLLDVWNQENYYVDVLCHAGICADEYNCGKIYEDMNEEERIEWDVENEYIAVDGIMESDYIFKGEFQGQKIRTTVSERRIILATILYLEKMDSLHLVGDMFK